ncbi:MAG TPA: GNAT family N-acetyltransferase [Chitinophagaceae bacterium]|nr:GNAT family N-acetyltransferase [Chitinophagaceae bacterium]
MKPPIRYVEHEDIDPGKWDACISNASNGVIYGYSFYLDHMAKHWDALILGDYEAVMALPWNSKYGIGYVYQPAFTMCCGVFGNNLTEALIGHFIQAIPKKFKLIEINLSAGNVFSIPSGFDQLQSNYTLSLKPAYQELYSNYKENIKRNIKKAQQLGCTITTGIPVHDVILLAKQQLQSLVKIAGHDFQQFEKLYEHLHRQQRANTYGVFSAAGELIASCVFFFSHNRAYYILVGNHPNGKTAGASHYLIDRFIADHAGHDMILDFEGSDIQSLAFFYSSFGAKWEAYPAIRINRLPWYVRLFKR